MTLEPPIKAALLHTLLPLGHRRQGKVRDVYDAKTPDGREVVALVATDRISAFDVVMPNGVPGKGIILTQMSRFWFDLIAAKLGSSLRHHVVSYDPADLAGLSDEQRNTLRGRVMIGRRAKVVPIECVVRGYLAGSGWAEYKASGAVCGVALPPGLKQSSRLPEPIFTPATKESSGHDQNISFARAGELVGADVMTKLRDWSVAVYEMARAHALERGIILADTKFEFGFALDETGGEIMLVDEVLTPDSSRYWPVDGYEEGKDQPSFDKQYVRDYLQALADKGRWKKQPPGPQLPDEVIEGTLEKYREAYRRLTGQDVQAS